MNRINYRDGAVEIKEFCMYSEIMVVTYKTQTQDQGGQLAHRSMPFAKDARPVIGAS